MSWDQLSVATPTTDGVHVQDLWNNLKCKTRVLLASALVFGTGYNLQKDCRVAVMVDTSDTDNREQQAQGLGQSACLNAVTVA